MKAILIIVGILVLGFIFIQIFAMNSQKGIETYPYTVQKEYDGFEVRAYEASLFSTVKLASNTYEESSSKGFSVLAGYIFGGNDKNQSIAMTSPVSMSLEDSMTMMFMVPKDIKKEDLPKPNQSGIEFKEIPAKTMAAVTFGGWANDEKIASYKSQLIKELDSSGIAYTNQFYFFGYNAPYEMMNRKNEVLVELK